MRAPVNRILKNGEKHRRSTKLFVTLPMNINIVWKDL